MSKNISSGLIYFYIHFVTEVVCFFTLAKYVGDGPVIWLIFLAYDMLAFVPQGIFGYFVDKNPKMPIGVIGLILLALSLIAFKLISNPFVSLVILCLGNCCVHVNGAEVTLRTSGGKLSGSAIFVSGGSFGVMVGKILAKTSFPMLALLVLVATAIPAAWWSQRYVGNEEKPYTEQCKAFNYSKPGVPKAVVIVLAVVIVAVRGYMGYGIPTSWNKTLTQMIFLYVAMGLGKALGGILADCYGFKKTAILSAVIATPLLMAGDKIMVISLIGIMLFSMTMSITLGLLVSVLPKNPGLAFGLTTIGLFIGAAPVFFFKLDSLLANCVMIFIISCICIIIMYGIIRKDVKNE